MKILIAEDSPIVQKIMLLFLSNAGYEVDIANDGREAVKCYTEKRDYDIILMDINMPEMDGFEATQAIRALEHESHIPIIAVTAEGEAIKKKCLTVGMDAVMLKPINIDALRVMMEEMISQQNDRPYL